jgi:hypothetical protein
MAPTIAGDHPICPEVTDLVDDLGGRVLGGCSISHLFAVRAPMPERCSNLASCTLKASTPTLALAPRKGCAPLKRWPEDGPSWCAGVRLRSCSRSGSESRIRRWPRMTRSATGERVLKADLPAARPRARKAILPLAAADPDRGPSTMPSCWRWRVPFLGGHAHVTLTSRQQILDPIPFVVVQSIAPHRSAPLKADCPRVTTDFGIHANPIIDRIDN